MDMDEEEVKLHGFWASPFVYRVIWALKLKGIQYDYVEEDLSNKSQLLLQYNPVHKQVPVLVHHGKPISDSLVILEYIEDTWPHHNPPLIPKDPFERALARFWGNFSTDKGRTFYSFLLAGQDEKEEAAKQVFEVLRTIEEEALGDNKFFGGNSINLVDIIFGWLAYWFQPTEELVGIKVLEPTGLPRLHAWVENFKEEAVIKENFPNHDELRQHFTRLRAKLMPKPN
ncbi:hypothetical protein ACH5RR_011283 [Cinchona calisaya]|uniref:Glutathione S-transferase n=1 Tax=Cinchona calisaya TaxID=153742 RepID=A0ABD3A716_9GENT